MNVRFNANETPALTWMTTDDETEFQFSAYPISCEVIVYNAPLITINVYYEGNDFCSATFKTNPADSITTQNAHAVMCAEKLLMSIYNMVEYERVSQRYWARCKDINISTSSPDDIELIRAFETHKYFLFMSVLDFVVKDDEDENQQERNC